MQMLHHWLERAHKLGHPQPASPRTILAACRSNLVVRLHHLSGFLGFFGLEMHDDRGGAVIERAELASVPLLPVKLPN